MNNPGGAAAAGNAQIDLMSWYVCTPPLDDERCVRIKQASTTDSSRNIIYSHPLPCFFTNTCRYMDIPPISRLYLTGAFLTTAACAVDMITPFSLYFSWELVVTQGQVWRLLTSYLFFGVFSIDFLFHMYNEDVKMSFLGFLTFHAPYLPWVMLAFSVVIGNAIMMDVLGIAVGHWYYYWEFVFPVVAQVRGWPLQRVLEPPRVVKWLCGEYVPAQQQAVDEVHLHQD